VVTGISGNRWVDVADESWLLQWGPVVVTGISGPYLIRDWVTAVLLQWGPVVVTGISSRTRPWNGSRRRFNGVRSW